MAPTWWQALLDHGVAFDESPNKAIKATWFAIFRLTQADMCVRNRPGSCAGAHPEN